MATGLGSAPPTLLRNASASPPAHLFSVGVLGLCCCVSFSVVVASWGYSLVACGLLVAVASRRGARLQGAQASAVAALGLEGTGAVVVHTGLMALPRVECSWTRDRTPHSCMGRQILYH